MSRIPMTATRHPREERTDRIVAAIGADRRAARAARDRGDIDEAWRLLERPRHAADADPRRRRGDPRMTASDHEATFAFVDLAGFTAVTEAHGDREAVALLHAFRHRVAEVLASDDELVKTIGDAVMLRFPTTENAVRALQALFEREIATPEAVLLPRAGAHHGRAVAIEGDYYGAAVNLASRVAGCARPGQLLVTSAVAHAAQALGSIITHAGTPALHNISEPVDLWDLRLASSAVDTTVDVVCRMRVSTTDTNAITLDWNGRRHHFCGLPCVSRFAASPSTYLPGPIAV